MHGALGTVSDPGKHWINPKSLRILIHYGVRITIMIVTIRAIFRRKESYIDVQPAAALKTSLNTWKYN